MHPKEAEPEKEERKEVRSMSQIQRFIPRKDYVYSTGIARILPRANYHPPTLHTQRLAQDNRVKSIEADWCPICHHRDIGEREINGSVLWHCNECGNEW